MAKHVSLDPTVDLSAITVPAAITGGESPTEAEFNALRAVVAQIVAVLNG